MSDWELHINICGSDTDIVGVGSVDVIAKSMSMGKMISQKEYENM